MGLAGKTLFITGASRGIGLAIALAPRAMAPTSPSPPRRRSRIRIVRHHHTAAEDIERAGGKALPLVVDVRDETIVKDALEQTARKFGGIDIWSTTPARFRSPASLIPT